MTPVSAPGKLGRIVVWIRRELRIHENLPLYAALRDAREVIPLFIFEEGAMSAPRLKVVLDGVSELGSALRRRGGDIVIRTGKPESVLVNIVQETDAAGVYAAYSPEPSARMRDLHIAGTLRAAGKLWREFKQQTIFDAAVAAPDGRPYMVFSAYRNAWLARQQEIPPPLPPLPRIRIPELAPGALPTLAELGVTEPADKVSPGGERAALRLLASFAAGGLGRYGTGRDVPGDPHATSRLSHHLASGSIAVQTVFHKISELLSSAGPDVGSSLLAFRDELIWREFYYQILVNHPHVVHRSFRRAYDDLRWDTGGSRLAAWKEGATGIPIVDAGMRQLTTEGWMHNRSRMITASFLTKDLHVDWRVGEKFFRQHLADADLAANNGGWQWCAGTGTDAQPWFRIFNPVLQSKRYDPEGVYIRRYLPELRRVPDRYIHEPHHMPAAVQRAAGCRIGTDYPAPVADHARERLEALRRYGAVRGTSRKQMTTEEMT